MMQHNERAMEAKRRMELRYLPKAIRNAIKGHSPQPEHKQLSKAERKGKTWQEIKDMREGK